MDAFLTKSMPFDRFAVNTTGNTIVFYNYLGSSISVVQKSSLTKIFDFPLARFPPIRSITWSAKGESLVINCSQVIALNIYTRDHEYLYDSESEPENAFLLDNRKLLLGFKDEIRLKNRSSMTESSFFVDAYIKAADRIVFVYDGCLTVLNLDFVVLFQKIISFDLVRQLDIYGKKYYFMEKKEIRGIDLVFALKEEIEGFKLTRDLVYTYSKEKLKVFSKHSEEMLLEKAPGYFFIDKDKDVLYILEGNYFCIYKKRTKSYTFTLIENNITYKEKEHEFDLSDDVEQIP